jgi:hypothetical protein
MALVWFFVCQIRSHNLCIAHQLGIFPNLVRELLLN